MSADFWAGYISGAAGIIIGNPLDIVKVRLQNGSTPALRLNGGADLAPEGHRTGVAVGGAGGVAGVDAGSAANVADASSSSSRLRSSAVTAWVRGATAPILTYGALNAILYTSYNRTLNALDTHFTSGNPTSPTSAAAAAAAPATGEYWRIWTAGAIAGLATWLISTPTELIKCRAQLQSQQSSLSVARDIWVSNGIRGMYHGGGITSVRDAVGYGFYFWSYELVRRGLGCCDDHATASASTAGWKILVAGGVAGVVTWTSIYPLDVVKTRIQGRAGVVGAASASATAGEMQSLSRTGGDAAKVGAWSTAKVIYRQEGVGAFFRGLGVCSIRAFVVNAVQWFVYERVMAFARLPVQPKQKVDFSLENVSVQ